MAEDPAPPGAAAAPTDDEARIASAWRLSYLDPLQAIALGRGVAARGGPLAAEGWLQVALGEVRVGDTGRARQALQQARAGFEAAEDLRGVAMCDEARAIELRRAGQIEASRRLHEAIDARGDLGLRAHERFLCLNSRAITLKLLGRADEALRDFYRASEAAQASGLQGQQITALVNLGGYHQDLFNLEDARKLCQQALQAAQEARAPQAMLTAAVNLITCHHALGDFAQARSLAGWLLEHEGELLPGALQRHSIALAVGHLAVGEFEQAQDYLEQGATAAVGDGDGVVAWAWLQSRCHLAQGEVDSARSLAESILAERASKQLADMPYELMQLLQVASDACEAQGDLRAALTHAREAQRVYERLVGRSARARYLALQAEHELSRVQQERDVARSSQRSAEEDRRALEELNEKLRRQVEETQALHERLREQALRDPLTRLHNRRYLFETAPGLLNLARRQASSLCVVLIDLDHFKLLNDTFGHSAGDSVLQRFSELLERMLRRSDLVCRYGGEEFVAVMPDIDAEGAQAMLTRLLHAYQGLPQQAGKRRLPSCSFSAGIAVFPQQGNTLEQLLSRADRALYSAKARGRARIEKQPLTDFGTLV